MKVWKQGSYNQQSKVQQKNEVERQQKEEAERNVDKLCESMHRATEDDGREKVKRSRRKKMTHIQDTAHKENAEKKERNAQRKRGGGAQC